MKDFLRSWWISIRMIHVTVSMPFSSGDYGCLAPIFIGIAVFAWQFVRTSPTADGQFLVGGAAVLTSLVGLGALVLALGGAIATFISIRRFEKSFGILPPTTAESKNALSYAIDQRIASFATNLHLVYQQEEESSAAFRALTERHDAEVDLRAINHRVLELEGWRRDIERAKRRAKRQFYSTRNAAGSKYLPWPFHVEKSFKDYLSKEATAKR